MTSEDREGATMTFPQPNSGTWTTGIFGCFEHCGSCWCVMCCPCVPIGRYVEVLDQGATSCCAGGALWCCLQSCTGLGCLYTCGYRSRLRQKFGLPESPCGDFLTECFCTSCSVCQVYRELVNRNMDPALGYNGVKHIYDQQTPDKQFMAK